MNIHLSDVLLIGTKYWEKLSSQEKKWLQEAADESAKAQKIYWAESVNNSMQKLKEAGVEVITPEKSVFAEKSKSVLEKFIKNNPAMKNLVNQIQVQ